MEATIVQCGRFTSDGTAHTLQLRSDVDWLEVYNQTQWATTQSTGRGVKFYWQRGLASGTGFEYTKADSSSNVLQGEWLTSGGFTLIDLSDQSPGAEVTGTTITKASAAVCSATNSYSNGDIVRIYSSDNMDQINGMDFSISSVSGSVFTLTWMNTNTANFTASTAFKVRKLASAGSYSPGNRLITAVTTGTSTVITMSVAHNFVVGQTVSFVVPSAFGMTQLDGISGNITAISAANNTITVDIDSQAFTAFAFPATTAYPLTFAQVVPAGSQASIQTSAGSIATNVEYIGIELGAGIDGPAGSSSDVIYWRAGKAWSVDNE